ncbi:hypothetical protein CL614_08720 [archaeon]|nr:hypothetical protein [archaeon]
MTFNEYYEYYLTLHQNKMCRRLHVVGQLVTILTLIYALSFQAWFLLLCVPFVVYLFAWSGHFFFEKNTPAAFSKPIWAKASDWIMLKDWLLGNIER